MLFRSSTICKGLYAVFVNGPFVRDKESAFGIWILKNERMDR